MELPHPLISREHAEIIYQAGQWYIHSLSPLSPVLLNAKPVTQAPLANGDIVSIAGYQLHITLPAAKAAFLRENTAVEEVTHTLPTADEKSQEDEATTVMPEVSSCCTSGCDCR